jgi:5-methylcytosine-specific restriction endonuclease McrA
MPVILEALIAVIAIIWFIVIGVMGIVFLPILLLLRLFIGEPPSKRTGTIPSLQTVDLDHHVHVPLAKVPPEYYEAYSKYLKSPEWRALRKLVLKRDKYKCVDCKDYDIPLQVHHIHYDGVESMTFSTDQCVAVCHTCHERRHGRHLWI